MSNLWPNTKNKYGTQKDIHKTCVLRSSTCDGANHEQINFLLQSPEVFNLEQDTENQFRG